MAATTTNSLRQPTGEDIKQNDTLVDETEIIKSKQLKESSKDRITICSTFQSRQPIIRHFRNHPKSLRVQNIATAFNLNNLLNKNCIYSVNKPQDSGSTPGMYLMETNNNVEFPSLISLSANSGSQWTFDDLDANVVYFIKFSNAMQNKRRGKGEMNINNVANIDWDNVETSILSLDGGIGGKSGEFKYIAPNGTKIEASAPVYSNSNLYYMEYLFTGNDNLGNTAHTSYWLTNSNDESQTLLFTFDKCYNISSVNICSTTYASGLQADRRSDYSINFKIKNCAWEKKQTVGLVDTKKDVMGELRKHKIQLANVEMMKITLKKRGKYGCCLKCVQIVVSCESDTD